LTQNPYAYGLNNPTSTSDPSGLWVPIGARDSRNGFNHRWSKTTNLRNIKAAATRQRASTTYRAKTAKAAKAAAAPAPVRKPPAKPPLSPQALALYNIAAMRVSNPEAYAALAAISALGRMKAANSDSRFWEALRNAGSGTSLVAAGVRVSKVRGMSLQFTGYSGASGGGGSPCNVGPWTLPSFLGGGSDGGCWGAQGTRMYADDVSMTAGAIGATCAGITAILPNPVTGYCAAGASYVSTSAGVAHTAVTCVDLFTVECRHSASNLMFNLAGAGLGSGATALSRHVDDVGDVMSAASQVILNGGTNFIGDRFSLPELPWDPLR
jgi:hypothetical protein